MATICQSLSTKEDNLWNYTLPDGRSIQKGIKYLYPFVADKTRWPLPPDVMYWKEWPVAQPFLLFGAAAYNNQQWFDTWKQLDHNPQVEEVIRNLPVRNPLIWIADYTDLVMPVMAQETSVASVMDDAGKQVHVMLKEMDVMNKPGLVSPRTIEKGALKMISSRDWCSGFFPGELWYLYEYTGNDTWKTLAEKYTANIEAEKTNGGTHDMGFKVYNSFGNGYRLTKEAHYKDVILEAAQTLSTRFNKKTGVIKSWDNRRQWAYPVIIDNMMNLELLFEAAKLSGNKTFYEIAVSHANTTMKNHFREDYSSWHVVDYDTATGKVLQKTTHQGYSDASSWSRGQSWGLYGYTMCYRETGNKAYLQHAEKIAAFILNHPHMPGDMVPYYDFDAPAIPNEPRDASAAAILASGLYELSTYSTHGNTYRAAADKIMQNLTMHYRSALGDNKGFILLHSTGIKPQNIEVDAPIIYADYYYLEALLRKEALQKGKKLFP
jgi:hypothetical protein